MADRRDKDPFANYNFVVEINGIQTAGFKEVSGPVLYYVVKVQ